MSKAKFKIWDKTRNKWLFSNCGQFLLTQDGNVMFHMDGDNPLEPIIDQIEYEVLMYTGLKDKNGKEICQGDIVERKCGNTGKTILRQVEYIGVSFCTKNGSFYNQKTKQREYCYIPLKPYVKVVGNIYENPELLKEGE